MPYPRIEDPEAPDRSTREMLVPPLPLEEALQGRAGKGPEHRLAADVRRRCPTRFELPVLLKVGDDISTDEIMPAGRARAALPQQHPQDRRVRLRHGRPDLPEAGAGARASRAGTSSSAGATTARAPAASTPPSPRATWACARSSPRASPASTGRTWSTSASCR